MLLAVTVLLALVCAALVIERLLWHAQCAAWARQLEELPPDSNAELSASVQSPDSLRLCRAINARLRQSRDQAVEAQRARRELQYTMAAVSHDIRTPLTGAAGYLELLRQTDDPARRAEYLGTVQRRLQDLQQLLDELFLYTRLTADPRPAQCRPTALYPAVCDALAALYPQLEQAGVAPRLDFPRQGARVLADPEALARVLRNLILNAARHGSGTLEITQTAGALHLTNRVPDPAKLQVEHLFDRFWRADAARSGGGAGLGLSIVRQLTEAMGGTVDAVLDGDRLTILLRLRPADAEPDPAGGGGEGR